MIITFIGHSKISNGDSLKGRIESAIKEKIKGEKTTFFCGGYGDFDILCAQVVKELKEIYDNVESLYVTPYLNDMKVKEMENKKLYDGILYPDLENVPYRLAILKRNEYMIKSADFIIAYVKHHYGGAYRSLQYADQKHKQIKNLAV